MTAQTPGQQTAADVEDKITAAVDGLCACGCKQPLPEDGPSAYFLGEGHQHAWAMRNAANPREVLYGLDSGILPAEFTRTFNDVARIVGEIVSAMPPPGWTRRTRPDWLPRPLEDIAGIPVVVSPLIPDDRIIMASDGTRDGLRTSVAMVKMIRSSLTPKPAPRRPWRRLLWWRKS